MLMVLSVGYSRLVLLLVHVLELVILHVLALVLPTKLLFIVVLVLYLAS